MTRLMDVPGISSLRDRVRAQAIDYGGGRDRHLGAYSGAMAAYLAGVAGVGVAAHRAGRVAPNLGPVDIASLALATNRLTRILSRERIASPLRAPFTRFTGGTKGPGQMSEVARGDGPREVIGELVTCPFCLSQWVATGLAAGLLLAPAQSRFVVQVFAALGLADFLQFAWAKADQATS
jgi:hypothetical protein